MDSESIGERLARARNITPERVAGWQVQPQSQAHVAPTVQGGSQNTQHRLGSCEDRPHEPTHHHKKRRKRHQQTQQHPQIEGLPTPSDGRQPTNEPQANTGSPKTSFSPGLPTRIASGQLQAPFDLHTQPGISDDEQAMARELDVSRINSSMLIMGYEIDASSKNIDGDVVPFWSVTLNPVQRLEALISLFHGELDRLMPYLKQRTGTETGDGLNQWKEDTMLALCSGVWPSLRALADRLGTETSRVVQAHGGDAES